MMTFIMGIAVTSSRAHQARAELWEPIWRGVSCAYLHSSRSNTFLPLSSLLQMLLTFFV